MLQVRLVDATVVILYLPGPLLEGQQGTVCDNLDKHIDMGL